MSATIPRAYLICTTMCTVLLLATVGSAASRSPRTLYVSVLGNDAWSGRRMRPNGRHGDGPFATLERARDAIRELKRKGGLPKGGVTVVVCDSIRELAGPFELGAEDSGTPESAITYAALRAAGAQAPATDSYRADSPGGVRLSGGKVVGNWQAVTDPAVLSRLAPAAQGHVLQADLRSLGITNFGEVKNGGLELFFQDTPMTLARWPNEGFVKIADVVGGKPIDVRGTTGDEVGKFVYEGDRPARWVGEKDPWVHGYWFWDWADERQPVESIDTARHTISLKPPYHTYGYRKGQWYYAFNLLSELDSPGEWYLDRETGVLYFWPPAPLQQGRPTVSVAPTLVALHGVSYVTMRGFTVEAARGTAITVDGGAHDTISDCTIRNVGGYAVRVAGGEHHTVARCDIYQTGDGGIILEGGDRKTLTPAGHCAEDNHIHHYGRWNRMYQPAIRLSGVGNRAAHNLIHDAPHQAVDFSGNDHVIEFNEIYAVCTESNDAGATYAGRDWTWRGNVIRYNYFHDIRGFQDQGCVGVYLDDMLCGTMIIGNIFYRVTAAAFIGGGRDNVIENNVFVDCDPAVHVDARAMNWAAYHVGTTMTERLLEMPYAQPPWSTRYPQLVDILRDQPAAPKGNVIARNICVGGRWEDIEEEARPLVLFKDNLLDQDPRFVDAAHGNFELRADSPAFKLGFVRIPVEKIGPRR
jgi:hypothetical protein